MGMSPRPVLVVEDEKSLREAIRRALTAEGYTVTIAESGRAAIKALATERPQLVLTDISMPDVGGLDVLRAALRSDPDVPVIVISAEARPAETAAGIREGAFHFLVKPLREEQLLATCRLAVETRTLRVQNRLLRDREHLRRTHALAPIAGVELAHAQERRPERAALERAAIARVSRFVSEAVGRASTRVLERALAEPEVPEALADVMAGVLLDDAVNGDWAAALLRGAHVQSQLLEEAGGALSAQQVGDFLGIGRAAVDKRRRQGSLLGLKLPSGDIAYPAAQFGPRDVLPGLAAVLGAFRLRDPWMQLDVLLARDEDAGGRTGFEALAAGEVEAVMQRAAGVGDQGL